MSQSFHTRYTNVKVMSDNYVMFSGSVGNAPILVRSDTSLMPDCSGGSLSITVESTNVSWGTGTNLRSKGLSYNNTNYGSPAVLTRPVDTNCYSPPACDVFTDVSVTDTVLCEGYSLSANDSSVGTGLSVEWYLDGQSFDTDASIDTMLSAGTYDLRLIARGTYCYDTASYQIEVNPVYEDTLDVELCLGDSFMLDSMSFMSDTLLVDSLQSISSCDSEVYYDLHFIQD